MLGLGKRLNKHKYEELVEGTCLDCLSLDEIIDIAINGERMNLVSKDHKFWEFAGAYYRFTDHSSFVIVIDREQSVAGYNNSELTLFMTDNSVFSNDKRFLKLIKDKIKEKTNALNN